MAGSDNDVHYNSGIRVQAVRAQDYATMQKNATDCGFMNVAGSPEGVSSANPGSLCMDRTNGVLYIKETGTGNTGWASIASGGVTSVSGTLNRITSTGGSTPVIDIDAGYVGQASITTLGTVTTGTWNGSVVSEVYGGTNQSSYATGDILYASGVNTLAKLAAGSDGEVLKLAGGVPTWAADAGGQVDSVSGTLNRITISGTAADPVVDIAATYVGQSSITTLGTVTTGTWNADTVTVPYGGTGNTTFTAYSVICAGTTATGAFQNVSGVGTSGQVLTSNGAAALPTWQDASGGAITFTDITAQTLVVNNGYFATAAGTYDMPATPAQGDLIILEAEASGVILDAPASDFIRIGSSITSSGGTITSTAQGDSVTLRFRDSTQTWIAVSSVGNWTIA